jgi:hypothetical protein
MDVLTAVPSWRFEHGVLYTFRGVSLVVNCEGLPWLFAAGSPVFDSYLIIADWNQLTCQ